MTQLGMIWRKKRSHDPCLHGLSYRKQRVLRFTSMFGKSGVKRIALCLEIAIPVHKSKVKGQPVVRNGMGDFTWN